MSKIVLLIVVASLVFLAFNSAKVREYFGVTEPEEAPPAAAEREAERDPKPEPRKRLNPY
jgi:hypothetical protein